MCNTWKYVALKGEFDEVETLLSENRLLILDDIGGGCHSLYQVQPAIWRLRYWGKTPSYRYFFEDDGYEIDLDDAGCRFNLDISMGCEVFSVIQLMEQDVPRWVYMGYK